MKKYLSGILAVLLMAQLLVSCGETEQNSDDTAAQDVNSTAPNENPAETEEVSEYEQALESLEKYNFDGHDFNMIVRINSSVEWLIWRNRDIVAEEMSGEAINDAVFERNTYVRDNYNCNITQTQSYNPASDLDISIKAGDNAYDVALPALEQSTSNAANGLFYNLNNISSLHLDAPWWDQNANESLSIVNKLYFTSGDMIILNNDSTGALVFNKEMANAWQVENPYELVREGKWTFDKFYDQISLISDDLNGDGEMNGQDRYGFMLYADAQHCLYHGAGMDYGTKDADDKIVLTYNTEQSINVLTRVWEIMNDENISYSLHTAYDEIGSGSNAFVWGEGIFHNNRAMYYWLRLRDVEGMRTMEADFGILPIPKWDESQNNYRATVNFYVSCSIAVPVCTYDPELTGIFLEAMSCVSKYKLQPAYYDITLTGKYPRDVESSDMLDLIFSNRVYDIGMFANLGGVTEQLKTMLIDDNRNFASAFKSKDKVNARSLDRLVKNFEELEY